MTGPSRKETNFTYHFIVVIAAVLWGTVSLFSGLLTREHVDVFSQILYRALFGVIFAFIFARFVFKQNLALQKTELKIIALNSLFTLGGWTFFMISIFLGTPIAKATVLMYTYPIYSVILSYIFLKEKPAVKNIVGILFSFISVLILLEVWKIQNLTLLHPGDLFALIDAIFTALVIVYGRKIRTETKINSFKLFTYTLLFMIPLLFIFGLLLKTMGIDIIDPVINISLTPNAWAYAIGIGAFGTAFTFPLLYIGLGKVKTLTANILLLFEVAASYMFGVIFFAEHLSPWGIIGMIGILLSTLLI